MTDSTMNKMLDRAFAPDIKVRVAKSGQVTGITALTKLGRNEYTELLLTEFGNTWHVDQLEQFQQNCCMQWSGPYFN